MRILTFDYETYWRSKDYSLSRTGPIAYIRDEKFAPQLLGLSINGQPAQVYDGKATSQVLAQFDMDNDVFVGHNAAGFDALILSEHFGLRPRHMWDTIYAMRWTGLSSISNETHKALTELLGNGEKKDGTVVSDGKQWPQDFSPEERAFFIQYCADDVNQCVRNMRSMLPYMTDDALQFMSITARMATEPVFVLDEKLLEEFIKQLDQEAEEARQKIMEVFHFATLQEFFQAIRSAERFASMLRQLGVEPPVKFSEAKTRTARQRIIDEISRLRPEQVDELAVLKESLSALDRTGVSTYAFSKTDIDFLALREHDDPRVRLLVETRLEMNSSILRSRAETLLKFARQGKPIPIMLSAFKARTGRYSAGSSDGSTDRMQFQNLSKRNPAHLPLRRAIRVPDGMKVVAVDSSQVEARVLAYEANHYELLDHFRQGRDPYAELAVNFDRQYTAQAIHDGAKSGDKHCKQLRNVAKTLILACGYGTSAQKFSDTLLRQGMKLAADPAAHAEKAREYHAIYRASNSSIVQFWRTAQSVIEALVVGGSGQFGGPNGNLFAYGILPIIGRDDLAVPSIRMPNGFCLRYPNLHMTEGENGRIEYVYDAKLGKNIIAKRLYGAGLVENCLAEGTLVYTEQGWKPIEKIELSDKVYDGVDFITHDGVLHKGIQECMNLDGVTLTPDHKVLTTRGWYHAEEVNVSQLARCELRGASSSRVNSSQVCEFFGTDLWEIDSRTKSRKHETQGLQGQQTIQAEVYDIRNCGPRHRFVVRGNRGPMIVSNCTQSLAFHILIWQACRMDSAAIALKGNNHDCWYTVVPNNQAQAAYDKMMWHMKQVPAWAADCPIDCDGEIGDTFEIC